MSTFSSANIMDGNLVLKERTHRIKIKYSMHQYSIRLHNLGNWLIVTFFCFYVPCVNLLTCLHTYTLKHSTDVWVQWFHNICRVLDGRWSAEGLLDRHVPLPQRLAAEISELYASGSRRCRQHSCRKHCRCCEITRSYFAAIRWMNIDVSY